MVQNILITGAAGYIGGTILADFLSRTSGPIKKENISAAVRSEEQVQKLSKLGVNAIKFDLTDEAAATEAVIRNEIDIVVHTAGAIHSNMVSPLIKALGQRRKAAGADVYFIHSSITAMYTVENGWPYGKVKDTDPILEKDKEIGGSHPVRLTNNLVTELSKAEGVKSFNVVVPNVYGRGTGEGRKLSVSIPQFIRVGIKHRVVYKFDKDASPPQTHVSDLANLYTLLVEKILQKEPIPNGEDGYYFAAAHTAPWWATMQRIAESLHARGLVDEPKAQTWPSDDMAAEYLGFPRMYVRAMCTSDGELVPVNAYRVGWQPKWDEKRFVENIDDEVQAVLDLDDGKVSLFDSLLAADKK